MHCTVHKNETETAKPGISISVVLIKGEITPTISSVVNNITYVRFVVAIQ